MTTNDLPPFEPFPSIPRLFREVIVTEKIDGTNASVTVLEDGRVLAGSRSRYVTPEADNFGFARWVAERESVLRDALGVGRHYGEWYGQGIQRAYGLAEKRFALFNTTRWAGADLPEGVDVVPILHCGVFDTAEVSRCLASLRDYGSRLAPGFMRPEGLVVFHVPSQYGFKVTLDKNDGHKTAPERK